MTTISGYDKINDKIHDKIADKINDKIADKVNDIYFIHCHYKGNHRRGAAAVRPRHLFCGGGQRPPPL